MFVLIHSPLVGPSSLRPMADALEVRGAQCLLPSLTLPEGGIPAWRQCARHLRDQIAPRAGAILVGHSAGGLLAARLASELNAAGVIFLDARIASEEGAVPPVEAEFLAEVRGLADDGGRLPPWSAWWGRDIFAGTGLGAAERATFEAEQPRLTLRWFDDAFDMPRWSHRPCGYLQTSVLFAPEADRAEALGWPTLRLPGSHLHPFLRPEATADALLVIHRKMGASSISAAGR